MKEQMKEKGVTPYNVMNNRVAKVALVASLLLTGVTTTISTVGPSNGIIGEWMEVNRAEAASVFAGGSGTVADPYLVSDKIQLNEMRNYLTSHFKLTSDINLTGIQWVPIGSGSDYFRGSFDGSGYTIDGLTIDKVGEYTGLFGKIYGNIKNVHLTNVSVKGSSNYVGAVVGMSDGTIQNVSVKGSISGTASVGGVAGYSSGSMQDISVEAIVTGTSSGVGGVAGYSSGSMQDISVEAIVTGLGSVGGIVGTSTYGTFENISIKGTVSGKGDYVGGIIGNSTSGNLEKIASSVEVFNLGKQTGGIIGFSTAGSIKNSFSTGNIEGTQSVGGIVGAGSADISDVYSLGDVKGTEFVGGIGGLTSGKLINAYARGTITGGNFIGGLVGGASGGDKSNLFALNKAIVSTGTIKGIAFGSDSISTGSTSNVYIPETSPHKAMQHGATHLLSNEEIISADTYSSLLENSLWEIDDATNLPILSFNKPVLEPLELSDKINYIKKDNIIYSAIHTKEDLNDIRNSMEVSHILMNDIDLTGLAWKPIGDSSAKAFRGNFDGNGYTINGLTINTSANYVGLFGYVEIAGGSITYPELMNHIKNVKLANVNIKGGTYTGGLAGYSTVNVSNVSVDGVVSGTNSVGGVIGKFNDANNTKPEIQKVSSFVNVNGASAVGGIVGEIVKGKINNSFSKGNISGTTEVGGVLGKTQANLYNITTVSNVYATGDVKGTSYYVGGIGGNAGYANITNAFATGEVTGSYFTGGLLGGAQGATLSNLFALNKGVVSASTSGVGKAVGTAASAVSSNIAVINTMSGLGHSDLVTKIITQPEAIKKATYSLNGFKFADIDNSGVWGIDEDKTAPYLMFNPSPVTYNPGDGSWGEGNSPDLSFAIEAVVKAEASKMQADVDAARILVNQLADGLDKAGLTNRLDILEKIIGADKALKDAKDAVDNIGDNPTQEELDQAKDKVNALPDSPEKDGLLEQIKDKQDALDKANAEKALGEQIAAVTKAVEQAETSKKQADVSKARDLVNNLPEGDVKRDLTNRLDAIQKLIDGDQALEDAKEAVDELGDNPTQEELDAVKDKVEELSDGPAKDVLLDQIKDKQDALDKANAEKALATQIAEATKAVEQAETTKTQTDITTARNLVNKLPEGDVKRELIIRLDALQQALEADKALEAARNLVEQLGDNPTQQAIDTAKNAVQNLPDGKDKTELLVKVEVKQDALDKKVAEAKDAVDAIGTPPTQAEINVAQDKVNALPKGDVKTELQQAINEKKKQVGEIENQLIKAEEAVSKAEKFPTSYNVAIAEKLVEALPNSEAKTALEDRLQAIQDVFALEKAEAKVKQAENYERDPYLADAIQLVDALKESKGKSALKERIQVIIDKLQAIKDAEEAEKDANGAYDPADPNQTIEDAIDTIQDPAAKKYFANWNKALLNAENYFSKATVKNATKYLTDLPTAYTSVASYENIIKELTERTENLKEEEAIVDVFASVEKAVASYEKYKTSYYLKKATEAVEALEDSPEKTAFEKRLGVNETPGNGPTDEEKLASQLAKVEKAVANYEKFKTNFYQKKATQAVEELTESEEKTAFQARLDAVTK